MKRILPYFLYLANVAVVFLVAWVLGFDILKTIQHYNVYVYLAIALILYGFENWLIDRIRGKT